MGKKYASSFGLFGQDIYVKDDEAQEKIKQIESKITTRYGTHYRDIIAGNQYTQYYGSDKYEQFNIGEHAGTDSDPYETLEYFFDKLNNGYTDIRCYIDTPGTYIVHKPVHTDAVIHITVRVSGVRIILNDTSAESFVGYNTHWNFKRSSTSVSKVILITPLFNTIYFENSSTLLEGISYDGRILAYGGYMSLQNVDCKQFYSDACNSYIYNLLITNDDVSKSGIIIRRSSQFHISGGGTDFTPLPKNSTDSNCSMIVIENSMATLEFSQNEENTGYYYGIEAKNAFLLITQARYNIFNDYSLHGNTVETSLVVHDTTYLPQ